jgi:hypothetical protein
MRKALIVFPVFQSVYPRPFRGFLEIAMVAGRMCPEWKFGFLAPERSSLPMAMNGAAQTVVEQGYDALIAFDDDCFPPFDCIPRLLAHYDAGRQFVAGVGVMRGYPHTTTAAKVFDEGPSLVQQGDRMKVTSHQWLDNIETLPALAEVDFCGVPVALMARSVFETVKSPWFGLHGPDGGTVTHDVFFCRKLKAAGIPVLVDTTLKCGHLAEPPVITFENRDHARELVG